MMGDNLTKAIIFFAGAAIGSVVTWKLLDEKYKRIAQEEIDSVKAVFTVKKKEVETEDAEPPKNETVPEAPYRKVNQDVVDYSKLITDLGYVDKTDKEVKEDVPMRNDGITVIDPTEFDTIDYETVSLTYYADGVVTDENDCPISDEDIEGTIGKESLNHFGEYEDDSVFVRNDDLKTDYEILLDSRNFYDVENS